MAIRVPDSGNSRILLRRRPRSALFGPGYGESISGPTVNAQPVITGNIYDTNTITWTDGTFNAGTGTIQVTQNLYYNGAIVAGTGLGVNSYDIPVGLGQEVANYQVRTVGEYTDGPDVGGKTTNSSLVQSAVAPAPFTATDWDVTTGSVAAGVDIGISQEPDPGSAPDTAGADYRFRLNGTNDPYSAWINIVNEQVGNNPVVMPETDTDYEFELQHKSLSGVSGPSTTRKSAVSAPFIEIITVAPGGDIPVMSRLYQSQSVSNVNDWAAFISTSNYVSSEGNIVSAVPTTTGDATDENDPLLENESAGFFITVTDDAVPANVQTFTADPITVEYKTRNQTTSGNELDIDINSLVPDAETISINVDSGPYAGDYTPTAGDLRGAPYNFLDTVTISGTTNVGDTLTGDDGMWSISMGTFSISDRAWESDNVTIPGATTNTFTITASEQGTDVTYLPTATDGAASTQAESAPLAIPGGGPDPLVATIVYTQDIPASSATITVPVADLNAMVADTNDPLFIVFGAIDGANGRTIVSVVSTGVTITEQVKWDGNTGSNQRSTVGIYSCPNPATWTNDLVITLSGNINKLGKLDIIKVPGASLTAYATAANGANGTGSDVLPISINTKENGIMIAHCANENNTYAATTVKTWTGLTGFSETEFLRSSDTASYNLITLPITADSTPLNFSFDREGPAGEEALGHIALAAISLEPV